MNRIKIGIVGYGDRGQHLMEKLRRSSHYVVTAVCDIDIRKLKNIPSEITEYSLPDKVFADEDVDVVFIAANNSAHKELAVRAAEAGKDIICATPAALSLDDLNEMLAAVDECGVNFTVYHRHRLDKGFQIMQNVRDSDKLGQIYLIKSSMNMAVGYLQDWHRFASEGGGVLMDLGVTMLDQMMCLMPGAKVTGVYADLRSVVNKEVDDYCRIILQFEGGISAEIELGTLLLSDKEDKWFEHHWYAAGTKGCVYVDGNEEIEGKLVLASEWLTDRKRTVSDHSSVRERMYTEELPEAGESEYFFENYWKAYDGQEEFQVTTAEILRVQKIVEAVRMSAATNTVVKPN
ncbi:MAG: Gfo/Idh/MocA family oxidoreductase [Eubacteriales bacterium]|nr:Gfo/Idh/MocA family oxidoreductase [Eubacteriales bacterium]